MRISDWSSDVCSSDLLQCIDDGIFILGLKVLATANPCNVEQQSRLVCILLCVENIQRIGRHLRLGRTTWTARQRNTDLVQEACPLVRHEIEAALGRRRSEEHTSELQSLMRISYAVFCLKKKKNRDKYKQDSKL